MHRALRAIGRVSRTPLVLVAAAASPASLPALMAFAKANPGRLSDGSAGIGSISHIVAEAFAQAADIPLMPVDTSTALQAAGGLQGRLGPAPASG